ncbi:hypothetical protein HYY71_01820 [Candidatus Woesearchaeota archaeon]|nr:hypothetical protein [Candidatus Woesearchaeota archaeon]
MSNNSRFFFILLSVGAAIGIGNVWLYPNYSYKFGGFFFVPYIIALFLLGIPVLLLEFSIGQYFNKNVVDLFASIKKWLSGIGWLMLFNAFIVMSYYAVALSWHIIYIFVSFGLQWKQDAKSYFFSNVLQASEGFKGFTKFSLPVFIALIIAWIVIFLYIKRGFESMKKHFLMVFPFFIALIFFFLLHSLSLDNALDGAHSLLKPRFRSMLSLDIWISSFSLAIISLGVSFGVMPAFARKSGKGFVTGNSLIVAVFALMLGFLIGFIMFGMLGFLSMKQSIALDRLVFSDFGFPFVVLAQALPFFYKPTLLSLLFFMLLAMFFIFGTASLAYSLTHALVHKFRTKHINAAIMVSGFGFLLGLLFIISPGFYIMDIAGHFVYYNVLTVLLLEAVAVGWFFDSEKISSYINQHSILKIGSLWRLFIRYLIPLILLLLLFKRIKSDLLLDYNNYPWIYVLVFGAGIVIIPLVLAFLMPQKILDRK